MNEEPAAQLGFDFRTNRPTAIDYWNLCSSQRAACTALNRWRAEGILEAAQLTPSGEPLQADVWNASFAAESARREIPLIDLRLLGISRDEDGMLASEVLRQLKSGAEASPFADDENNVVYKLFDLRGNGSLGKKVILEKVGGEKHEVLLQDATLQDTLEKLMVLNDAGGHPTEIAGLSDDGNFLIAKQPLAHPWSDLKKDRKAATEDLLAIVPPYTDLNREIAVFWLRGEAWILCDLHTGNIMRTRENRPTIIDALLGRLPRHVINGLAWASEADEDSRALRLGLPRIKRVRFGDDVDDDDL